jgi:hypothetical protein
LYKREHQKRFRFLDAQVREQTRWVIRDAKRGQCSDALETLEFINYMHGQMYVDGEMYEGGAESGAQRFAANSEALTEAANTFADHCMIRAKRQW